MQQCCLMKILVFCIYSVTATVVMRSYISLLIIKLNSLKHSRAIARKKL